MNPADASLARALMDQGNQLKRQGRYREALEPLTKASRLAPHHAAIWLNRGVAHLELGQREEAAACFRHAVALEPHRAEAQNILGHTMLLQGRCGAAAARLHEALRLRPEYAAAHDNLARVLKAQGHAAEALLQHEAAMALEPKSTTHSNLLYTLNLLDLPPEEIYRQHRKWALEVEKALGSPSRRSGTQGPIRIGYVSPDLCSHAVAFFFESVLEHHDRSAFEIFCYSDVKAPDAVTTRLRGRCGSGWRDTASQSDDVLEKTIRADGIDILVDLAGHTAGNRLRVFARRPAPIQVTWLGYPNTTGLSAIDYRITDPIADPVGTETWHSEQLVRLAGPFSCYRPPECAPDPAPPAEGAGRPLTFGSFNHLAKLSDSTVRLWSEALRAIPSSRLFLKSRGLADPATRADVRARFAAEGVAPSRLEFSGEELSVPDHLALYRGIDVALDTFPYNGATTTCEALWMGVPVVTLAGKTHVSRVSASMLTHSGLDGGVAWDAEEFVAICQYYADPSRRGASRLERRARMATSPLCDGAGHARALENAFRDMLREKIATPAAA